MFFAKTLIERTPKYHLRKHPRAQNNSLVVICNEYWSTSKYQVKENSMCIWDKTEICHFVHIIIIIHNIICFTHVQQKLSTFLR